MCVLCPCVACVPVCVRVRVCACVCQFVCECVCGVCACVCYGVRLVFSVERPEGEVHDIIRGAQLL